MSDGSGSTLLTEAQPEAAPTLAPAGNPPVTPSTTAVPTEYLFDLPEDMRSLPAMAKFQREGGKVDGISVLKGYANLERMLGGDKVPVPKDWEDEGQRQMLIDKVRPKTADEYQLPLPVDLPDEVMANYSKDQEAYYRELFHKAGLSPWQAKVLFEGGAKTQIDSIVQSRTDLAGQRQEAERALKLEWGNSGYDQKINAAKVALQEYGDPEFFEYLDKTGLGNHPKMLKAFAKIGEQMIGDTKLRGTDGGPSTPADLDAAIAEFRVQNKSALMNRDHPEHKSKSDQLTSLYNRRFGK